MQIFVLFSAKVAHLRPAMRLNSSGILLFIITINFILPTKIYFRLDASVITVESVITSPGCTVCIRINPGNVKLVHILQAILFEIFS